MSAWQVPDEVLAQEEKVSARDVLAEQVRLVHRMASGSAWTMSLFSAFVAAVLHDLGPPVLVWLAVQLALKLAAYVELKWFFPDAAIQANPEHMARRLMLSQSPHAIGWAALIWVAAHGAPTQLTFAVMMLAGVLAGGVTTYGALPRIHVAYIATFISAQVVIWLLLLHERSADPVFELAPLLASLYCLGIFFNTRVAGRTYQQFILLGFANARLARRLEQEVASTSKARQEAEAANAAKSTFLASASHDLRQPIHALGLSLALLERTELTVAQRETLALARSSLSASSEMLDTLLDFSRAEAGVIAPRIQRFQIGAVLREIEAEIAVTADEKGLVYRTRDCDAAVESDPGLVKIILLNLVSNAIRYTAEGGILVGCRRRGERVVIEVWDTGMGIPASQHEAVFSDFVQLGNPERDHRKGLGLGLAIARRLARLLGGEITLDSVAGRGSVFRFSAPLWRGAEAQAEAAVIEPLQARPVSDAAGPRRVLIIDDDEAIRVGLGALLRETGYAVEAVETIAQAQASCDARPPDVLICDYRLRADESGAEAARLLRAQLGRRVPALLITGDTHPDRIAEAAREDMEILYKPTHPDHLLAAVARLLAAA